MTTSNDSAHHENSYFSDQESGAEMARLLDQDRLMTRSMGGLFSERSDLAGIHRLLDIACGPGGWALEVAYSDPALEIVGIDVSQQMIEHARVQAQVQGLHNASFLLMDALQPLEFPSESFDLVNIRLLGFLPPDAWPRLLQECLRVTRPGGIFRWTESEVVTSNSAAVEKMWSWFALSLKRAGQSFSPDGRLFSLTPVMKLLLRQAGYRNIQHQAHVFEGSVGTETHDGFCRDLRFAFKLFQPFFLSVGVTTQEEVDQVYEQMLVDLLKEDFCAMQFLLTVWGEKP